ncbi:hypothetical protein [Nesterenkonia pannonica]|uniref:hypothetical protein n=1 Tax=Nesterenkonia pannonica TaxID=1548602 RepID=UPI0021649CF6|nr:hypothetical protein [Nesterenkonia pannonica]
MWHAGGDAVRNYTCRDETCCPYPGFSISAELDSSLERLPQLTVRAGAAAGPADLLDEFLTPVHAPSEASQRVVRRMVKTAAASESVEDELTLWGEALSRGRGSEPSMWLHTAEEAAASMLRTLARKRVRDALVPLASVGYPAAVAGTLFHEELRRDPGAARLEDGELWGRLAPRLPQGLDAQALDRLLQDYANCWLGATGSRPDWRGIEVLEALLKELLPYAEAEEREAALTLKAWIEWVKGRSSVSSEAVDLIRREFGDSSDCTMAELVDRFSGFSAFPHGPA